MVTGQWKCYFDAGGFGRLNVDQVINFTWPENRWFLVEMTVDLDLDQADMYLDGVFVHDWTWTLGASGGSGPLVLDANDFFGATPADQMYFDDYVVIDLLGVSSEPLMSLTHTPGDLNVAIFNEALSVQILAYRPGVTWLV